MSPTLIDARRASAATPDGLLVLLHGRGTSEQDLLPLFDVLDPERRLAGAAPRGPLQLPGQPGNHWYEIESVGNPNPETFTATYAALGFWLERLGAELEIPIERTVLGGFSQGTVMAYSLGLGAGRSRPAGILALSGFIPTVDGWEAELESRRGMPVLISHGRHDPIISIEFAVEARQRLSSAALEVSYREGPIAHSIDGPTIDAAKAWLETALPRLPR